MENRSFALWFSLLLESVLKNYPSQDHESQHPQPRSLPDSVSPPVSAFYYGDEQPASLDSTVDVLGVDWMVGFGLSVSTVLSCPGCLVV